MRQDPDVILVGEVRDAETAEALLAAAETGHLVFATLHVGAATLVCDRIAGMFGSVEDGAAVKARLVNTLAGVLTQTLVPSRCGRSLAWELLVVGREEREMLRRDAQGELRDRMAKHRFRLSDSLARLVAQGLFSEDMARAHVNYHDEWDPQYLESQRSSSPSDLPGLECAGEADDCLDEDIVYGCL
jgi:twitching motility protein PilT